MFDIGILADSACCRNTFPALVPTSEQQQRYDISDSYSSSYCAAPRNVTSVSSTEVRGLTESRRRELCSSLTLAVAQSTPRKSRQMESEKLRRPFVPGGAQLAALVWTLRRADCAIAMLSSGMNWQCLSCKGESDSYSTVRGTTATASALCTSSLPLCLVRKLFATHNERAPPGLIGFKSPWKTFGKWWPVFPFFFFLFERTCIKQMATGTFFPQRVLLLHGCCLLLTVAAS